MRVVHDATQERETRRASYAANRESNGEVGVECYVSVSVAPPDGALFQTQERDSRGREHTEQTPRDIKKLTRQWSERKKELSRNSLQVVDKTRISTNMATICTLLVTL